MDGLLEPMNFGDSRLAFDRLHTGTFVAGAAALSAAVMTCVTRRMPRTLVQPPPLTGVCKSGIVAMSRPASLSFRAQRATVLKVNCLESQEGWSTSAEAWRAQRARVSDA